MSAPLSALVVAFLAARGADLAALRDALGAPQKAARVAAASLLRATLAAGDVPAAVAALRQWPADAALALEVALIELPKLRGALLESACRGDPELRAPASALLRATLRRRIGELAPFRPDRAPLGEATLPWSQAGWRVVRHGAPRAPLAWGEVLRALRESGAFEQAIVTLPEAGLASVPAPLPAVAPAEAWLGIELRRRDLHLFRGVAATWVVAADRPPPRAIENLGEAAERALRIDAECDLFERALRQLATLEPELGGALGGELLATLGIAWVDDAARDDPFGRGLHRAAVAARLASAAAPPPSPSPSRAAPDSGVAGAPLPAHDELVARLAALLADERATTARPTALDDFVDALLAVVDGDPLLCGELADQLAAAVRGAPEGARRAALAEAAAEIAFVGRSARPGSVAVDLPDGGAAR